MSTPTQSLATRAIHADHYLAGEEVAAGISLSTTFRHPDPEQIAEKPEGYYDANWDPYAPSRDIYSRETQPTLTRAEKVLESVIGYPTLVYPSGISAFFAILLHVRPDVVAIGSKDGPGYHGCQASLEVYRRTRGTNNVAKITIDDELPDDGRKVLIWLETPLNPTGESYSIAHYARKGHAIKNGVIGVDSTFAPPPLQDPFKWDADIVMHSGTKYLQGHSDSLIGTVSVKTKEEWMQLWEDRTYTGQLAGSLDAWLLLRSLRTLNVRVTRQAKTATTLAHWLDSLSRENPNEGPAGLVEKVWHTTLQDNAADLISEDGTKQMAAGPACFGVLMTKEIYAEYLPSRLQLFFNATSLGGVESLVEQRVVSDKTCDPRLIRLSVGLEDFEDLKADFLQAFDKVRELASNKVPAILTVALDKLQLCFPTSRMRGADEPAKSPVERPVTYTLSIVQQPIRARMCGFGDKDRRPITPPLIVKLDGLTPSGRMIAPDDINTSFLILAADLRAPDLQDANVVQRSAPRLRTTPPPTHTVTTSCSSRSPRDLDDELEHAARPRKRSRADSSDSSATTPPQRDHEERVVEHGAIPNLVGTLHTNAYTLTDLDGEKGVFFVLPDLSVRTEGTYRIRLRLLSIGLLGTGSGPTSPVIASAQSQEFQVYAAKKFGGMLEPTALSKHFAKQGVRIPTRRPSTKASASTSRQEDHETAEEDQLDAG
ncbi:hypothetical protein JCM10212_007009 [Sporobolomyces blumeae]